MDLKGLKIGFLGDSISEGTGASSYEKSFVGLFAAAHPEAQVFNHSIGATKIAAQIVPLAEKDNFPFFTRVEEMDSGLDVVFIFGGTNDFGHGDVPMGEKGVVISRYTFYGALFSLILDIQLRCPKAQIVIVTPIHRHGEDFVAVRPDGRYVLKDYVDMIKSVAEYFALPVLDLWSTSGIQPNIPANMQRYAPDGLHPNDAGHKRLFELFDRFIKQM